MRAPRFARGVLAPKGLIYTLEAVERPAPPPEVWRQAIERTARQMLAPVPIVGVRGIRMLARAVARLDSSEHSKAWVGHIVRMQEEIGTGGAGFRFLYAAFLQEAAERAERPALNAQAEALLDIGDAWRSFALRAARMIRGREPFLPAELGALLQGLATREAEFFGTLRRVVR